MKKYLKFKFVFLISIFLLVMRIPRSSASGFRLYQSFQSSALVSILTGAPPCGELLAGKSANAMENPIALDRLSEQLQEINEPVEINILTFNVWGVFRLFTESLDKRVKLITTSINGFDLVNLQETTVVETKDITDKNNFYPYKVRYDNTSLLRLGSGLSTLSKYKILEEKFLLFSSCLLPDCINNKGVLFLRLEIPKLGIVDLYNTHYQSMPISTTHRLLANKDFEKFYKENNQDNLTIITGDFNLTEKDEDYRDFVKKFKVIDTFRVKNPNIPGFTYDKEKNSSALFMAARIDYIFVVHNEKYNIEILESKIMFTEKQEELFISDHFGLATLLKITKKGPGI